jgi:hypothetical protein
MRPRASLQNGIQHNESQDVWPKGEHGHEDEQTDEQPDPPVFIRVGFEHVVTA